MGARREVQEARTAPGPKGGLGTAIINSTQGVSPLYSKLL
jgi:hypothetical protein